MAELANAYGLGPYGAILGGSTPLPPTKWFKDLLFGEGQELKGVPINATNRSICLSGRVADLERSPALSMKGRDEAKGANSSSAHHL